jgi:hypothetical protein
VRVGGEFFQQFRAGLRAIKQGAACKMRTPNPARSYFGHTRGNIVWNWHLYGCPPATEGNTMTERAEGARPSEIVWVALYSVLVLLLMLTWASVPT